MNDDYVIFKATKAMQWYNSQFMKVTLLVEVYTLLSPLAIHLPSTECLIQSRAHVCTYRLTGI